MSFILPGAAVLCVTTYLTFCSFQICLCFGPQGAKDRQGVWDLEATWILLALVQVPEVWTFTFLFWSGALAFERPDADSFSSIQLYLKLDGQGGNTEQMINVFHLLGLPADASTSALSDAPDLKEVAPAHELCFSLTCLEGF